MNHKGYKDETANAAIARAMKGVTSKKKVKPKEKPVREKLVVRR